MSYCTIAQIRTSNKKLESSTDVTDAIITDRISEAEKVIKVDLSSIISETDLDAIGSDSNVINLLAIYKTTEKTLVTYFGTSRRIDEVSDIQYYSNLYKELIDKILSGEIKIVDDSTTYSPKTYPGRTSSTYGLKLYPRKGVPGFVNDGAEEAYKDDEFTE